MTSAVFCLNLAKSIGLQKSVFLAWVAENEHKPMSSEEIVKQFSFMPEEEVFTLMNSLVAEGFIQEGYQNARFKLALNRPLIQQKTGVVFSGAQKPPALMAQPDFSSSKATATLDPSVGHFLKRFKGEAGILDEKLNALRQSASELIHYAVDQGLTAEAAQFSFEKFMSYIQSDPQKFYNRDLHNYWAFWVSNSLERNRQNVSSATGGKQSAIEENNRLVIQSLLGDDQPF